jgi:hypothetical protein
MYPKYPHPKCLVKKWGRSYQAATEPFEQGYPFWGNYRSESIFSAPFLSFGKHFDKRKILKIGNFGGRSSGAKRPERFTLARNSVYG